MPQGIENTLHAWFDAMLAADVDGVMRGCCPDFRLGLHFGDVPLPFIGVSHGADAARRRTEQMFKTWRFRDGNLEICSIDGPKARSLVRAKIVHRWTGLTFDASIRNEVTFDGHLMRTYDAYMDAPRFAAFMQYVGLAPSKRPAASATSTEQSPR
jgi:hypothetical protein